MKKVITYGTFDLFHQGHYNIIKRAKAYGDYLIVGVTSESYDIERGKLSVHDSLLTRIENVKKTGLVDEIIVEEYLGQKTRDIIQYDIDTLVVGSTGYLEVLGDGETATAPAFKVVAITTMPDANTDYPAVKLQRVL